MAIDGFTYIGAGDVRWEVHHNGGTTFVYAPTESIALARFMAKYPNARILDIKRR